MELSRLESGRNPAQKPDFRPGNTIAEHRVECGTGADRVPKTNEVVYKKNSQDKDGVENQEEDKNRSEKYQKWTKTMTELTLRSL